jgi:hypothetical protein
MPWAAVITLVIALPLAAIAFAAWYGLAVPGTAYRGPLPPETAEERDSAARLKGHVTAIASVPHNLRHYAALEAAASHIERTLESFGYTVDRQIFEVEGRPVRNIEATLEPSKQGSVEALVVGAHYDSFESAPGANDNGTGVAAVLELARLLQDHRPQSRRIRFALFVNEEPPYYRTADMGSWRYAKQLSERGDRVHGMLSLETIGYFSDKPGSQQYPAPFSMIYPSTGDFIAFVGLPASRGFLHEVIGSFRRHAAFPSIGGVAPDAIPGIGWSDHWAFREFGYPAIMLTDTAPFRYPHYHLPSDTPDKIDYSRLARITRGLERVLRELAD